MSLNHMLEKLDFAIFEFVLVPGRTIVLPEFKGNVFRGALGKTLRYLTCAFKDKKCRDCLIYDKCIYSKIFESIHTTDKSIREGKRDGLKNLICSRRSRKLKIFGEKMYRRNPTGGN